MLNTDVTNIPLSGEHAVCAHDSDELSSVISNIQATLEEAGYRLGKYGEDGDRFVIVVSMINSHGLIVHRRCVIEFLKQSIIHDADVRVQSLLEAVRQRREALLEKMAKRASLASRRTRVPNASSAIIIGSDVNQFG